MALPREHLLDELATAYVQAMAAAAGATVAISRRDYGIDGTLRRILRSRNWYFDSGFPVDFQLKGTSTAAIESDHVAYDLKARNFDLIVGRPRMAIPYYLFLICFPRNEQNWIAVEDQRLLLGASAFWWTDSGFRSQNERSVRLRIPIGNRLTISAIRAIVSKPKTEYKP